jgi:hypothetical protein
MSKKKNLAPFNKEIDEEIFEAMCLTGLVFPETVEGVIHFENEMKNSKLKLPAQLSDHKAVLNRAKTSLTPARPTNTNIVSAEVADNLAIAARNGREITPEIRELMNKDRKRSESKDE